MRTLTFGAISVVAGATLAISAGAAGPFAHADVRAALVLDTARVRAFRTTGASLVGVAHGPGVVVPLEDGPTRKAGDAYWAADAAIPADATNTSPLVIVEPKAGKRGAPAPQTGSRPGDGTFVGLSFKTLFENDRVTAIRARMEVNATEGLHTHRSDTIVVHLSGGAIEDTADGTTKVNRWKPGDVELEPRGSSHSARNIGQAIDVVLVALKP